MTEDQRKEQISRLIIENAADGEGTIYKTDFPSLRDDILALIHSVEAESYRRGQVDIEKLAKECVFPQKDWDCEVMNYTLFKEELKQLRLPLATSAQEKTDE